MISCNQQLNVNERRPETGVALPRALKAVP